MCFIQVLDCFFDLTFADYKFFNNRVLFLAYIKYLAPEGVSNSFLEEVF